MEPLFINQYVRDEAVTKEYLRAHYLSPASLVIYIFAGIAFILNLILLVVDHAAYDSLIILLVAGVVLYISYRLRLATALKRDLEQFGQPPTTVYEVSETGIRVGINGLFSQEVPFSQFRRVKETKHLILLISKARLLYIFHKDGFIKGSAPEFNRFLWDKNLRLK